MWNYHSLFWVKNVIEYSLFYVSGVTSSKRKEIATELLKTVQMGDRLDHYPNMLSGGEQQRVTIARAMANKPGMINMYKYVIF
jgi:ABC-type polar amino acid transport system ATPase subunit